jgi:hypothetical protein
VKLKDFEAREPHHKGNYIMATYQFTRQSLAKKPTRHIDVGLSADFAAQTIEDKEVPAGEIVKRCAATAEMAVGRLTIHSGERFHLVAVAAVSPYFPTRFFVVVERQGEYTCSREWSKVARIAIDLVESHRQARREAKRAQAIAC